MRENLKTPLRARAATEPSASAGEAEDRKSGDILLAFLVTLDGPHSARSDELKRFECCLSSNGRFHTFRPDLVSFQGRWALSNLVAHSRSRLPQVPRNGIHSTAMHEYVTSRISFNEAKAPLIVIPLKCATLSGA